jgi:hypothetical protein
MPRSAVRIVAAAVPPAKRQEAATALAGPTVQAHKKNKSTHKFQKQQGEQHNHEHGAPRGGQ